MTATGVAGSLIRMAYTVYDPQLGMMPVTKVSSLDSFRRFALMALPGSVSLDGMVAYTGGRPELVAMADVT